jgi:signal transduction histidine kinase
MLQVAFDNIVDNALKYGLGKPVQVSLCRYNGRVQLQVADEGMGINQDEKDKLFEPFYRNEGVRHIQGMGIGLSLVKSIIDWHGWSITLKPNQPSGTVLIIDFA